MPDNFISLKKKTIMDYLYAEKVQNFVFVLFLSALFVFALMFGYGDFQERGIYWIVAVFLLYFAFKPGSDLRLFDAQALTILIGFYLIAIFKFLKTPILNPIWDFSFYAWLMPMMYLLGKAVVGNNKRTFERRGHVILTVLTVGMYIQGFLNYYMLTTPLAKDFVTSPGFWNREKWWGRNMWDVGFDMAVGTLFYALLIRKKKKHFFIATIVSIVVALAINLYYGGRTETVMTAAIFLALAGFYVLRGHVDVLKKYKKIIIGIVASLVIICLIVFLLRVFNVAGFAEIYNSSFIARDGGIFNNIRFQWAKEGIKNIFIYGKGGWANDPEYIATNNSWLEYGRNFDIIVFLFLAFFLVITIIKDVQLLFKHGNKHPVCYFAVGSKMGLMLISIINPDFCSCFDMMTFFVLASGITSGIKNAADSGDYKLLNQDICYTKYRFSVIGFCLLTIALLGAAYIDWWNDKLSVTCLVVAPIVMYLVGTIFTKPNIRTIVLGASAVASLVLVLYMHFISKAVDGYYLDPFSKGTTIKSSYLALWIIPVAVIIGAVFYYLKVNKIITAVVAAILPGVIFISQIRDGRLGIIKEAARLLYCVTMKLTNDVELEARIPLSLGTPWVYSSENYMGLTTSHNMWLDFARDYTVIVYGLLIGFEIWAIIAAVKMILKKDKQIIDYILIVAFALFNYHFMFEATGYSNRYIFNIGLFIYAMIASRASDEPVDEEKSSTF